MGQAVPTRVHGVFGAVAAGAYAWWVTGLPPFSAAATIAVVGGGCAALALARLRTPISRPTPSGSMSGGVLLWALLISALAAWQLAAFLGSPRSEHPTLSSMANALLEPRPLRALAVLVWLGSAAWLAR